MFIVIMSTDLLDKKIIRGRSLPFVYLILRYGVEKQSVHDWVGEGTNFYKTPNIYIIFTINLAKICFKRSGFVVVFRM